MQSSEDPAFFSFGDWTVRPSQRSIERQDERVVLEPKLIDVLTYLAGTGGEVVSTEQLLAACWRGTFYGDNPVHKTMALLRKALQDDARSPRYIATVRKRGYQVVAKVAFADARERATVSRRSWNDGSPFRGLLAFGSDDRDVFFGRARATAELLRAIRRSDADGCAFVLVAGPSGCGKSSLVQAGIVPALLGEAGHDGLRATAWTSFVARTPTSPLVDTLAGALCRWAPGGRPVFVDSERPALGKALVNDLDFVIERIEREVPAGNGRLLLVVDAMEGLLTQASEQVTAAIAALDRLARSGRVIVLGTCRNDFYPQLMAIPGLLALKHDGGSYDLAPPTQGEMAQIIRLPARAAGLHFGRDPNGERMLDDVLLEAACRHVTALPLLQYTLQALYEAKDEDGTLTFAAYEAMGGLEGALAQRAERIHDSLDARATRAFPRLLHRLVAVAGDGDGVTARTVRWIDIDDDEQHAVRQLIDARLLVSLLEDDEPCFTLAHEALLRHWPRVAEWVQTHRADLRARARIAEMAARWSTEGQRREHLIPRGQLLADAKRLSREAHPPLDATQARFIGLSLRQARFTMMTLAGMAAAIAVLALISTFAAVNARKAERHAEARRADAESLLDFMLGDMNERLDALGRLDLLDEVTHRAMQVMGGHDWKSDAPDAVLRQAKALREIGEIRFARGDSDGAIEAFQNADTSLVHLVAGHPDQAEAYAERGKLAYWRGQIAFGRGKTDETAKEWNNYLEQATLRAKLEPDVPDAWLELSYAHNCLGSLAQRTNHAEDATREFDLSSSLKRRVLGMQPTDRKTWLELADTMGWEASVEQQRGKLRDTLSHYMQEREAVLAARESGDPTNLWLYRRALADLHVARAHADLGMVVQAESDYTAAATTFAQLVRDVPDNRKWQRDLALTRSQQGWLAYGVGDTALALRRYADAGDMLQKLLAVDAKVSDWRTLLAVNRTWESMAHLRMGELVPAAAAVNEALGLFGDVPATAASNRVLRALADMTAGEIARQQGDAGTASTHLDRALTELRPRAEKSTDPRVLDPYVRVATLLGHQDEAAPYLERLRQSGYRSPAFEMFVNHSNQGKIQ